MMSCVRRRHEAPSADPHAAVVWGGLVNHQLNVTASSQAFS